MKNHIIILVISVPLFVMSGCGSMPITASLQDGAMLGARTGRLLKVNQGRTQSVFEHEVKPILNLLQKDRVYKEEDLYKVFGDRKALVWLPLEKRYALKGYLSEISGSKNTEKGQISFLYFGYVKDRLVVVRSIMIRDEEDRLLELREYPDEKRENFPRGEKWMDDIALLMFSPDKWLNQVAKFNSEHFASKEQFVNAQAKLSLLPIGTEWETFFRYMNGCYFQIADDVIPFMEGSLTGYHMTPSSQERRLGFGYVETNGEEVVKVLVVIENCAVSRVVPVSNKDEFLKS